MDKFIKERIAEHKEIVIRISKLETLIANWNRINDRNIVRSHVTYANFAILLASYKKAAEALECLLENRGVIIDEDGYYREAVDRIVLPADDNESQDLPQNEQENGRQ